MSGTFFRDFTEGFAQLLVAKVDASVGLAWQSSGKYSAGQTGIFAVAFPATPDRLVTLTPYPLTADPVMAQSEIGLQIRSRGATADPREVMAIDDAINDALLGLFPVTLPTGVAISSLAWTSGASLGQEEGGTRRWAWSSNYTANTYRPSQHRN